MIRDRLNIKTPFCQYIDPHYKDETVVRPSYLDNRNPHTWKDSLYIETGPGLRLNIETVGAEAKDSLDSSPNRRPSSKKLGLRTILLISFQSI